MSHSVLLWFFFSVEVSTKILIFKSLKGGNTSGMDFQKLHFLKSNESTGKSNQNQLFQSPGNLPAACQKLRSIYSRKIVES